MLLHRRFLILMILVTIICFSETVFGNYWERAGCHKVGYTRRIRISGCVEFDMTTNACRGFCLSYATPSTEETLNANPNQAVTSVGQCCNIMDTEDVPVKVRCMGGLRDLVFKSAVTCSCFHCKKE